MGFVEFVKGLLGIEPAPDYAKVEPGNPDAFWLIDHEIDQAGRDSEQALQEVYARYGLRDEDHYARVKGYLYLTVKDHPEFHVAATRVQHRELMAQVPAEQQVPREYTAPVEGVSLDKLALIHANMEAAQASGADKHSALARYGLDADTFGRIDRVWRTRMSGLNDVMAGSVLSQTYRTHYLYARAGLGMSIEGL